MKIFRKMFIKDYNNVTDKNVRLKYGLVAGVFGIISNLILFLSKLLIGIISASVTIIADAINNLSDMGSCVVVVIGFKLSNKPADSEHPFGHARYEQIMALIVSVFVMMIGVLLAKESITKVFSNETTTISIATYVVLAIAIIIKFVQMLLYRDFADAIDSNVLKASSIDSRNDVISTSTVLLAMLLIGVLGDVGFSIDGLFGIIVSIFILVSSIKLLKETIGPLLGEAPDKAFVKQLKDTILAYEGVLGLHDFLIHSYGKNNYFANVHVEVAHDMDFMKAHDMIDNIERDVMETYGVTLSIHLDPIETNNKEVIEYKSKILQVLQNMDCRLTIHDFRMVFGDTHINVLFDVVVPFECKIVLDDIKLRLNREFTNHNKQYFFVITIDRS